MKILKPHLCAILACAMLAAGVAHAQRVITTPKDLEAQLREAMPDFLKGDNQELVGQLLGVQIAPPLSRTFDPNNAIKLLFGDGSVIVSTDCRRTGTPVGERDPGDCVASIGDETGPGAFRKFSWSKNIGMGNLKYLQRNAVPTTPPDPAQLPGTKLTDAAAYEQALKFLGEGFGLPVDLEIPKPPSGAALPVRSLNLQGGAEPGLAAAALGPVTIQKVVLLRRGFPLGSPIPLPGTNFRLTHVPGPGKAMVMLDDSGIVGAAVQGWQDLRRDPTMDKAAAKSGDELLAEMAEDLFNEGVREFVGIRFNVLISTEQRGQIGLLLPAVQVALLPAVRDPTEQEQRALAGRSTGGLIKEFALVNRDPLTGAGRPRGE